MGVSDSSDLGTAQTLKQFSFRPIERFISDGVPVKENPVNMPPQ